jgi:hypothetical protein
VIFRRLFSVAYCLSFAIAATAQVNVPSPPQTEQIEVGFAHLPGRPHVFYRIRLLPVSSFPQLPPSVAQQLAQRGCMIPQTYEARQPENVIHGSFEKKGSSDWAALCSIEGVTTLYVFFQSKPADPILLRHQPDSEWLGTEWSQDYGSAWGIATRPARLIPHADSLNHDAIDDAFIEKSTTVHYFEKDQWTTLESQQ